MEEVSGWVSTPSISRWKAGGLGPMKGARLSLKRRTMKDISNRGQLNEKSGIGREGSKYGVEEFLEVKYLCMGGIDR
jgi:hypothetical protein